MTRLKDIADMQTYLQERCYCPGEIYDSSGFFFMVYSPEDECSVLAEGIYKGEELDCRTVLVCVKDQLISVFIGDDGKVIDCERYDATENNIKELTRVIENGGGKVSLDEFKESETAKNLNEILKIADAVMVD